MMNQTELHVATASDVDDIAPLVNRAYRPSGPLRGWTHEVELVSGSRTTPEQLRSLCEESSSILVLRQGQDVVACVHLACNKNTAHVGMLATAPERQGAGFGKLMLEYAEQYARDQMEAPLLSLSVILARPELIAFYERRGYSRTGEEENYPLDIGAGSPFDDDLRVITLIKPVSSVTGPAFVRSQS